MIFIERNGRSSPDISDPIERQTDRNNSGERRGTEDTTRDSYERKYGGIKVGFYIGREWIRAG